jgi:hypothetical protein
MPCRKRLTVVQQEVLSYSESPAHVTKFDNTKSGMFPSIFLSCKVLFAGRSWGRIGRTGLHPGVA